MAGGAQLGAPWLGLARLGQVLLCFALLLARPALALEPLSKERHINDSLRAGFIADQIADNCAALATRRLRGIWRLLALRQYALQKGYLSDEIDAFVHSGAEKARLRAEAADWLQKAGAEPCAVGRAEMAKDSPIGQLLREGRARP